MKMKWYILMLMFMSTFSAKNGTAQENVIVNLAQLDGIDLTPDNIFNFQIHSGYNRNTKSLITGVIRYRNNPQLLISYKFTYDLVPGINLISSAYVHPRLQYSSNALRELFEQYKKLPEGIYEYCVTVQPDYQAHEAQSLTFDECIYHRSASMFLINLISPENNAKIYSYHPMLNWTVNYPFVAALTYKLRVTEIKRGQNTVTSIRRNNAVFEEDGLSSMSLLYPVYAKPLEKDQPYAWTVDAYYKNILIGTAEPWRFTIVEDSLLKGVPMNPSFIDIKRESSENVLFAPGVLKLKYDLKDIRADTLTLTLLNKKNKTIKMKTGTLNAVLGDNRFLLDFKEEQPLKHLQHYTLIIRSQTGDEYRISFRYINPDYISN